jgi:DNA ligase-1
MDETQMHHGKDWRGQNVRGWLASEKYRGVRGYWDGAEMWSRGGLRVDLPAAWREQLPVGFALDGEVWAGRGPENGAEETAAAGAVVRGEFTAQMRFMVFDAPGLLGTWYQRMRSASTVLRGATMARPVGFEPVRSMRHLEKLFAGVMEVGGEGLILRHPTAVGYEADRTSRTLKVKLDPAMARGVVREW